MADKVTDYKVVAETDPDDLAASVKKLVKDGWQPWGNPFEKVGGQGGDKLIQAMVKLEKATTEEE